MMNKYHWSRQALEECFPIGSKVLYCGTTNPKLVGRNGVVTGYSQSDIVKVHFDAYHAVVMPDNIVIVPEGLPPAPTSGLYLSRTGRRHLVVAPGYYSDAEGYVRLCIEGKSIRLSSVTARDLASDLYRMARQLEKDEKE